MSADCSFWKNGFPKEWTPERFSSLKPGQARPRPKPLRSRHVLSPLWYVRADYARQLCAGETMICGGDICSAEYRLDGENICFRQTQ